MHLPHSLAKLKRIFIKQYFIDNQEFLPNSLTSIQIPLAKAFSMKKAPIETLQTKTFLANISQIEYTAKSLLATLAFPVVVK